jgi:hypothetical protein
MPAEQRTADGTAQTLAALLAPDLRTARLNLSQPPMSWLVDVAAELDGRLVGSLAAGRAFARFDGVQLSSSRARQLAARIAEAWPETADAPAALPAATAEAWTGWTATWPIWSGTSADLLSTQLPPDAAVVGVIWD